jgi:hypothetical protein
LALSLKSKPFLILRYLFMTRRSLLPFALALGDQRFRKPEQSNPIAFWHL